MGAIKFVTSWVISLGLILSTLLTGRAAGFQTGLNGRYILSGTVEREAIVEGFDINDNARTLHYIFITDVNGDGWCYAYPMDEANIPSISQKVTLVMNSNGTPDDIEDDIIEDVLWCNCPAED